MLATDSRISGQFRYPKSPPRTLIGSGDLHDSRRSAGLVTSRRVASTTAPVCVRRPLLTLWRAADPFERESKRAANKLVGRYRASASRVCCRVDIRYRPLHIRAPVGGLFCDSDHQNCDGECCPMFDSRVDRHIPLQMWDHTRPWRFVSHRCAYAFAGRAVTRLPEAAREAPRCPEARHIFVCPYLA